MKTNKVYFLFIFTALIASIFITFAFKEDDKKKKKEQEDPSELYSMGEIKAMSADSIPFGTYVALSKEVINKKAKKITMKSISIDQKGESSEYNYTMNITDPTFTIMAEDSSYTGSGKLHGAAWKWSSWSYIINTQNPVGKIDAYNYISLAGLIVNKAFYDANGKLTVRFKERYKAITKEQFEILYLQVLKCSTK
jgi:hypothetical protein